MTDHQDFSVVELDDIGKIPLFVHVGYPRTGSTLLQQHIIPARKGGVFSGVNVLSRLLAESGTSGERTRLLLIRELCRHGYDGNLPIWFSDESLSGDLLRDEYGVAEKLHTVIPEARVIVCLRSQISLIPSFFAHACMKSGYSGSYAKYVETVLLSGKFDYYRFLAPFWEFFGMDGVCILLYEDLASAPMKFMRTLFAFMGVPPAHDEEIDTRGGNRNIRPAPFFIMLAGLLNRAVDSRMFSLISNSEKTIDEKRLKLKRFFRYWLVRFSALGRYMGPFGSIGGGYQKTLRNEIAGAFRASNGKLAECTGLPLAAYGYPCEN